jgi:hypothetical protein
MYKLRMGRWKLQQNFKLEELEAVAKTVQPLVKAGFKPPEIIVNNRKVPRRDGIGPGVISDNHFHFRQPPEAETIEDRWPSVFFFFDWSRLS